MGNGALTSSPTLVAGEAVRAVLPPRELRREVFLFLPAMARAEQSMVSSEGMPAAVLARAGKRFALFMGNWSVRAGGAVPGAAVGGPGGAPRGGE